MYKGETETMNCKCATLLLLLKYEAAKIVPGHSSACQLTLALPEQIFRIWAYSKIFYVLGNSVGLSVKAINVVELVDDILPSGAFHIANIVSLADYKTIMVGLTYMFTISKPFNLEEQFTEVGN